MPTNKIAVVNVQSYTEQVRADGSVLVTGRMGGVDFRQEFMLRPPVALFYDPSNGNVYAVPIEYQPGWQLMSIITSATPDPV